MKVSSFPLFAIGLTVALTACRPPTRPDRILEAELADMGVRLNWNPLTGLNPEALHTREVSREHVAMLFKGNHTEMILTNCISRCGQPAFTTKNRAGLVNFFTYTEGCFGAVFSCGSRQLNGEWITDVTFNKPEAHK